MADHQRLIRVRVNTTSDPKLLIQRLAMVRGVKGATSEELPGPYTALDISVDPLLKDHEIEGFGEQLVEILYERKDVVEAKYEYIWSPTPIPTEKWIGTDDPAEIVKLIDGEPYIRLDYYVRGHSYEDLGISDAEMERLVATGLQTWQQPGPRREAIRRNAATYNRLPLVVELAKHLQREEHAEQEARERAKEPVGAES